MKENNKIEETKKTWTAPVLVEYGDVNVLTQSKKFNPTGTNVQCQPDFLSCQSDF